MTQVFLNGKILPLEAAHISVMDRGFLFGDGVYEVVPVYGGRCFRLDEHLDRLDRSLRETRIPQPYQRAQWCDIFAQLIATETAPDQMIYVQITRGPAPLREHRFPHGVQPTVFAFTKALPVPSTQLPAPIAAVTCADIRWLRCDIKSVSLLANVLMAQTAADAGGGEAILIRDGCAREGSNSNVFAVVDGVLRTAPADRHILTGVTRNLLIELCAKNGVSVQECAVSEDELWRASEIWVTSSSRELQPVTTLDGRPVGSGAIGPVFEQLWQWYVGFRQTENSSVKTA
jgi:D-alanine transaminase